MNFLEERIVKDGIIKSGNVLKVDCFLNHQMDIALMEEIGREFKRRFGHKQVDKVLTIEASGIGIAAFVAKEFGVPMVFAKKSKSINIDGEMYSDKELHRISYNPKAKEIEMNTLSSLVDYIKANVDEMSGQMIIHVQSPTKVEMYSELDMERKREYMVEVNAKTPEFSFNKLIDHEAFCINLQSKFMNLPGTDRALLLKFAGTVEAGTVAEYGDDGVTQKATVKTGLASKSEAIVPNPVILCPYRTFIEVEQPFSQFIFRMKEERGSVYCGLFEADGGAWKIETMRKIKAYLEEQLEGIEGFIIIS